MTVDIVWPQEWAVPVHLIEAWFVEAVSKMLIPPGMLSAKSPLDMAKALDYIGWIVTKDQTP